MIAIYEPPKNHDYLGRMYFDPMRRFMYDHGIDVSPTINLEKTRNCTVLIDTEQLTPDTIAILRNNGCKIAGFNMVDSSHLAQPIRNDATVADVIFTMTGIQLVNQGLELEFDDEFNPVLIPKPFMEPDAWERFDRMRYTGRLHSLPYVHWNQLPEVQRMPYEKRDARVMIRGGPHARRVLLAFWLMRANLLHPSSGFDVRNYFKEDMQPILRFCDECRAVYNVKERYPHHVPINAPQDCTSRAKWGGDLQLDYLGYWNNRCPRSFYWLAERFGRAHGFLDSTMLESLFNTDWLTPEEHLAMLNGAMFTSDLKWLHSIYAAQRYWDATAAGCINLLPSRTTDQVYFPDIAPNVHYLTFQEDFSMLEFDARTDKGEYEFITENNYQLYRQWIRPDGYALNSNLIRHIIERLP